MRRRREKKKKKTKKKKEEISADQSSLIGELSKHFGRQIFSVVARRGTELHTLLSDKVR
jgi:hypothetical protein